MKMIRTSTRWARKALARLALSGPLPPLPTPSITRPASASAIYRSRSTSSRHNVYCRRVRPLGHALLQYTFFNSDTLFSVLLLNTSNHSGSLATSGGSPLYCFSMLAVDWAACGCPVHSQHTKICEATQALRSRARRAPEEQQVQVRCTKNKGA